MNINVRLAVILMTFLLLALPAMAQDKPTVEDLISKAIESLNTTSYEGRMRFSDPYGDGSEKLVDIVFVSPSDFKVQPLLNSKQKAGYYFIESAEGLVKVYGSANITEEMPARRFIIDNLLRRRVLELMAGHENVNILTGSFNGEPVYILRDEVNAESNYSITIHISRETNFPLSLQQEDERGNRQVYYEFEEINYIDDSQEYADIFSLTEYKSFMQEQKQAAPIASLDITARTGRVDGAGNLQEEQIEYKPRSALGVQKIPFPLIPVEMPNGYTLSNISPLDFGTNEQAMLVYQLELFNPNSNGTISIFQTKDKELEELFSSGLEVSEEGYYVATTSDGWLIAVFGDVSKGQFNEIFTSLSEENDAAYDMLNRALSKEELLDWAEDVCTRETHPDPQ